MNKKIILYLLTFLVATDYGGGLSAQAFSGTENGLIPGNARSYYCSDAGVSIATVDLMGRVGENYVIDSVLVDLTHEHPEELQLSLVSPRGRVVNLSIGNGGGLDGAYTATVFTDNGGDIGLSAPPFTGKFAPQGGLLNDVMDGELVNGEWRLEICDYVENNRDGIINEFTLFLDPTGNDDDDPVYEIDVASIQFTNINLDADCQRLIVPEMVLSGNFDADGDGNRPPKESFNLIIMDSNPCNGPVLDGCGEFEFWISPKPQEPEVLFGFDECTGGENILQITQVPNPGSGQSASVDVTEDTITLTTQGGSVATGPLVAQASYVFPRAGTTGFRLNFSAANPPGMVLDIVRVSYGDIFTPVVTDFDVSGLYTFAQPIEVEDGDILQFSLRNPNGRSPAGASPAVVKVFDFFFQPTVADVPVTGLLALGGLIMANDATPVTFVELPDAPEELYTSQISEILVSGLSPGVSRSYRVDGPSGLVIDNSLDEALEDRLLLGGGLPLTFDGCSDVIITVNDQITSAGNCQDIVVTRTFIAQDDPDCIGTEGPPEAVQASYQIVFKRAGFEDVIPPAGVVEVDCSDFNGTSNPQPTLNNYPRLAISEGEFIFLDQTYDNLGVSFTDGPRINVCENTYKFVRTYTVFDWCDIDAVAVFNQLVKVGDFSSPMIMAPTQDLDFDGVPDDGPLFFSTNATNCTAFVDITSGVVISDECSTVTTVSALIFPDCDLDELPLGPFDMDNIARDVPRGDHLLRYIASDACGNTDTLDVKIRVGDASAPVAKCEDGLNLSLGGGGTAILNAEDVNKNSYDDCTPENGLLFEVARLDANNEPIEDWQPFLVLDCSDLGMVRIGLRVTDDANGNGTADPGVDNSNRCFTELLVEDLGAPVCIAPSSFSVSCSELDDDLPDNLNVAFANDPVGIAALLDAEFGAPSGVDNCPSITITQTVEDTRTGCGSGLIIRRFGVEDAQGFVSLPNCTQTINVVGSFDYSVVLPADQTGMDCVDPDFNGVDVNEDGCSMITVSMRADTFAATANECYVVRITYEILDLCEYNTEAQPYILPRDADADGVPGEGMVLIVHPGPSNATLNDDVAILDTDLNRFNGFIDELDSGDGGILPGANAAGYGQDASRGAFIYQQFISVTDNTAPVVSIDETNDTAMDQDGNCAADFTVDFSISDECSNDDVSLIVDVDFFVNDANNDGVITANEFSSNQIVPANQVLDIGEGDFRTQLTDLPMGRHAIRVRASDGCGNTQLDIFAFEAVDSSIPPISCIMGLTATLSATEEGGGAASVRARNFVVDADNMNDCSGALTYAIYRIDDIDGPNFMPSANDDELLLSCEDLGDLQVRVYAIDPVGMTSFCETILEVQDNNNAACGGGNVNNGGNFAGLISGEVHTPSYEMRQGVEINVTANAQGEFTTFTGTEGTYLFRYLMEGDDYTVQPLANPAVDLTTITTGDLILMSRHILAIEEFSSPFQYVAADVNDDHQVNVLDMIAIRRIILGLTTEYPGTNSWRFIAESHDFGSDRSRWLSPNELMDVYNINNLEGEMLNANFMAIELGNVSAATTVGELVEGSARQGHQVLNVAAAPLHPATIQEIAFYQPEELLGFQTTLELAPELELLDVILGTAGEGDFNLSYVADGLIGIAHVSEGKSDAPLFTLRVRAEKTGDWSEFLRLTDRLVITESYPMENEFPVASKLELDFTGAIREESSGPANPDYRLSQNRPNPFRAETRIDFQLPAAGEAMLTVRDLKGRTLTRRRLEGIAGLNTLRIGREELGGTSGLLTYTIDTRYGRLTRKMLVTR